MVKLLVLILMTALSLHALAEDGWVHLFNGKNLDGWTQHNGTDSYKIEGDTIVGTMVETFSYRRELFAYLPYGSDLDNQIGRWNQPYRHPPLSVAEGPGAFFAMPGFAV